MKKLIILLIIGVVYLGHLQAQSLKVKDATSQEWSGGVAGHHGVYYNIILTPVNDSVLFDSLYVNNIGIKLIQPNGNVRIDKAKNTYTIVVQESHYDVNILKQQKSQPAVTRHFKGAALILYKYKGKSFSLIVKKLQPLTALCYP